MSWLPGSGGGGGGGGGGSSGPVVPEWVWDPRSKILGVVREWLAGRLIQGVLAMASFVLTAIYQPFAIAAETVLEVADILVDGTAPAGSAVIGGIATLNQTIASAAAQAGIAAPILVWILQVIEIVLVLWLLRKFAQWAGPIVLSFNPL